MSDKELEELFIKGATFVGAGLGLLFGTLYLMDKNDKRIGSSTNKLIK